jgi:hypothetical protein
VPSTRAKVAVAALSAGVSATIAAVTAELWLRGTPIQADGWPPRSDNEIACMQPSLTRGYAPRPGACGRDADGAIRHTFAGPDPTEVMLVGDSLSTHAWVPALARSLAPLVAPRGLDVHNLAVSGYDTCQEAATWEERSFTPDLLVLQTCPNDLGPPTPSLVRVPGDQVRYYGKDGTITFPAILLQSRLATSAALLVGQQLGSEPTPPRDAQTELECLDALREGADRVGVPLVVLEFPAFRGEPPRGLEVTFGDALRQRSMDTLDIRALLADRDAALLVSPDGVHPNTPAQTTALAEVLAPLLAERLTER